MATNAKPDGYTIGQITITAFRVPVMQKATFDPVKDFTYIIHLGGYSLGVVVLADGPFKKWQDVIEFAKANRASSPMRRSAPRRPMPLPWS